jgi:hypothetical protein
VLFGLSSAVFWYGGWPFLRGFTEELRSRRPGMMTLISVAIATAYVYSSAVVFGLAGKMFFWELASLIDIMLLGHWIEMKSVMGASRALEELAKLMPSDAHKSHEHHHHQDQHSADHHRDGHRRVVAGPGLWRRRDDERGPDGLVEVAETTCASEPTIGKSGPPQSRHDVRARVRVLMDEERTAIEQFEAADVLPQTPCPAGWSRRIATAPAFARSPRCVSSTPGRLRPDTLPARSRTLPRVQPRLAEVKVESQDHPQDVCQSQPLASP